MIPWLYLAGAAAVLGGSGYAGWQVRDWKCDADTAEVYAAGIAAAQKAQVRVEASATRYEGGRARAIVEQRSREVQIRTVYRDHAVAGECEPPVAAVVVLQTGLDAANADASGQPGAAVPGAADPAEPAAGP